MYCESASNKQEGRVVISLTSLTPTHLCACPKSGPGLLTLHVVVFFCVCRLTLGVIVRFVELTTV